MFDRLKLLAAAALLLGTALPAAAGENDFDARSQGKQVSGREALAVLAGADAIRLPNLELDLFKDWNLKVRLLRLRLAKLVSIPGLSVDPMARRMEYQIVKTDLNAGAAGVYAVDMGSRYRLGWGSPRVRLTMKSRGAGPDLRAELSEEGLAAGLGLRLGARQSVDYALKSGAGSAPDHRVSWNFKLAFKS